MRLSKERWQRFAIENLRNQQDGIGAGGARFQQLIAIQNEVLAQQRRRNGGADLFQIGQMALEKRLVGQHADAGGAVIGVGAGDGDRIEIGADQSCGRRRRV